MGMTEKIRKNKTGEMHRAPTGKIKKIKKDGFDESNPYRKTGAALYFIDISPRLW